MYEKAGDTAVVARVGRLDPATVRYYPFGDLGICPVPSLCSISMGLRCEPVKISLSSVKGPGGLEDDQTIDSVVLYIA